MGDMEKDGKRWEMKKDGKDGKGGKEINSARNGKGKINISDTTKAK